MIGGTKKSGAMSASKTMRETPLPALSIDQRRNPCRKSPASGTTSASTSFAVTVTSWTNTIGAAELGIVWTDPDFDPAKSAFYYVRVLQIPTPRHTLLDAIALGIDPGETGHPATIQERAWTSPIWINPHTAKDTL